VAEFCYSKASWLIIAAIGIFQEYYQTDLLKQYTPSSISWIVSLETFFMFLGGPIIGTLYDNYGPRWILLCGSFLHVFGLFMTSLSTEYYQILLSQGICSPLGSSMVFYSAMSSTVTWFYKRRALALGLTASGSSLGGVIFPIMVQNLIPQVGFAWTMRISAFLILGCLIIANLTVRARIPPSPRPFNIMNFIHPLKERPFFLLTIGAFFIFMGLFLPLNFVTLSALSLGMDANLASYLLSILNAASVFGRILPGWAGDHLGRFNVQITMCAACAILVLALWLPSRSNAPTIVFSILYGFASGAFVSIVPALVAQISDIRQIGVRTGTMFAIVSIAALIGNPIGGALLGQDQGYYTYLQIFSGVSMALGTAITVLSKASVKGMLFAKF
jgi:MFS family permease